MKKMKKLTTTIFLTLFSLLMAQAHEQEAKVIDIYYSGSTAKVNIPDECSNEVTASVTGANVIINSTTTATEYTYRVSGKSADGSLLLNGNYKLTLMLAGIELTNAHNGAAIDVECGKRINVELAEGTVNTLADAAGSQKAALYFKGHVEFGGGGTLNVIGRVKHAISSKEEMKLKRTLGTINILGAVSDGFHCGKGKVQNEHNCFNMNGGTVTIAQAGSDGVDSDDYGTIKIDGGSISINVGDKGTGLKADSLLRVTGGQVSIAVPGIDAEGIRSSYEMQQEGGLINIVVTGDGSKGIKANKADGNTGATVLGGGSFIVSGGETEIHVLGGSIVFADDVDKCMGISVDADFIQTDGTLSIIALGLEASTYKIKGTENRTGGSFEIIRAPWNMNPLGYQYDMSAYVTVKKGGKPLTDYTSMAVGAFINGQFAGYAVFLDQDYGIMRIRNNNATDSKSITFKLYDYNEEKEYKLTTATNVAYVSASCVGTPDKPLTLSYEAQNMILGDGTGDGTVDISDYIGVANYILGIPQTGFNVDAADVNKDGVIDISDYIGVANIILTGKP